MLLSHAISLEVLFFPCFILSSFSLCFKRSSALPSPTFCHGPFLSSVSNMQLDNILSKQKFNISQIDCFIPDMFPFMQIKISNFSPWHLFLEVLPSFWSQDDKSLPPACPSTFFSQPSKECNHLPCHSDPSPGYFLQLWPPYFLQLWPLKSLICGISLSYHIKHLSCVWCYLSSLSRIISNLESVSSLQYQRIKDQPMTPAFSIHSLDFQTSTFVGGGWSGLGSLGTTMAPSYRIFP